MVLSLYSDSVSSNPNYIENIESSNHYDMVQRVNASIAAALARYIFDDYIVTAADTSVVQPVAQVNPAHR